MANSKHCKEKQNDLKYNFSLREFMAYKQNIDILEFMDAASDLDEYRANKRVENGKKHN